MQTLVQVVCAPGPSVRDAIANDPRLEDRGFAVVVQKKPGRTHGWLKLRSASRAFSGVINVEWHDATHVLICRVVNKRASKPYPITGAFVNYLLQRPRVLRRIQAINVIPR